jgi:hypothetical protein
LETAGRPALRYVSVDRLGPAADADRNGAAILLAALSRYLMAGGSPPHSVMLTETGRALLCKRRRLIE